MTTERTGSGGEEWAVAFLGQREFASVDDTLKFATGPSDTEQQTREHAEVKDRWNSWVFSARADGFANGEESRRFLNIHSNVGADRITERWKIATGIRFSTSRSRFTLSDGVVNSRRGDASFGLSYSFGATNNNVVNQRFGR